MELVVDGSNYFETYEDLLQRSLFVLQTKMGKLSKVEVFVPRSSFKEFNDTLQALHSRKQFTFKNNINYFFKN